MRLKHIQSYLSSIPTPQFPDPKISDAIRTLWRQQLFENITFSVVNKSGKKVYLDIRLKELPKIIGERRRLRGSSLLPHWQELGSMALDHVRQTAPLQNEVIAT